MSEEHLKVDALAEVLWPDTPFALNEALVLVGRRGSEAHGTFIPTTDPNGIDDRDLMGIVVQPPSGYFGLRNWSEAQAIKGPWDVVLYDIRKFIHLAAGSNPNVLTLFWLREEDYLFVNSTGRRLLEAREMFVCRDRFYEAFAGYARGQLHRMTSGKGDPKRGFMGARRKKLVEQYGYDCKNAAHLIRLLHMAIEYLSDGKLNVFRTWDAPLLKEVKTGQWSLEAVQKYAADLFVRAEAAHASSPLPPSVDAAAIENLCVELTVEHMKPDEAKTLRAALLLVEYGSCDGCGNKHHCVECGAMRGRVKDEEPFEVYDEPHKPECPIGKALGREPRT